MFSLLSLCFEFLHSYNGKKQNSSLSAFNFFKKEKPYDPEKSAVYRIFTEFLQDDFNRSIISIGEIKRYKLSYFNEFPELFDDALWVDVFFENKNLITKINEGIWPLNLYSSITKEHIIQFRHYSPKLFQPDLVSSLFKSGNDQNSEAVKILKFFETEIKSESFKHLINFNTKLVKYREIKKEQFKWTGMWSDKVLFYEKKSELKHKNKNHFTTEYSKPLIGVIFDIDNFLPQFVNFDKKELFNEETKKVTDLNILEILSKVAQVKEEENQVSNILKDVYKNSNGLWKNYEKIRKAINETKKIDNFEYEIDNLTSSSSSFRCCLANKGSHITGKLVIENDAIILFIDKRTFSRTDPIITSHFDMERNACYGTYNHPRDKRKVCYTWNISDISHFFFKRFYINNVGIELYTNSRKSYLLVFSSEEERKKVSDLIVKKFPDRQKIKIDTKSGEILTIGYYNVAKKNKNDHLQDRLSQWETRKISNFEFLMSLNNFSSRSFNDLCQYPIMPWHITNFKTQEIDLAYDLRDLSLPMGMLEVDSQGEGSKRKEYYETIYETISNDNPEETPYFYGSFYSSPLYTVHYLVRVFPYSYNAIELQGDRFDDPNRLFQSVEHSFFCAATMKGDVRELIPEFFYLPEMFDNSNNLKLGVCSGDNLTVHDVKLPEWSKNKFEFISKMKTYLESDKVSETLNNWIDLIFGFKSIGKEAAKAKNLFLGSAYEKDWSKLNDLDQIEKDSEMRKVEFGVVPWQLFSKPMPIRKQKESIIKGASVLLSNDLKTFSRKDVILAKGGILKMKVLDNQKIICVFKNAFATVKFTQSENKYLIDSEEITYIDPENTFDTCLGTKYVEDFRTSFVEVIAEGDVIFKAGYFDGRISVYFKDKSSKNKYFKVYHYYPMLNNAINSLLIDEQSKILIAGSENGMVFFYSIKVNKLNLFKTIGDHSDSILSIVCNNKLGVFCSSAADGYVNMYTFPNLNLYSSIRMTTGSFADYLFLSSRPLYCMVIYSKSSKIFSSYTINGEHITSEIEECKTLITPRVYTDECFNDKLVYGKPNGHIKIIDLPFLTYNKTISLADKKNLTATLDSFVLTADLKFLYSFK